MPYARCNVLVHIVFSTHERRPLITPDIASDLHAYLGGIVAHMKGSALAINGALDHVHILARMPPTHGVSELIRVLKANSCKWIHERRPNHRTFAWQSGYGAFSVSESNVSAVRNYVNRQAEHHRKKDFREEFLAFLRRNKIQVDEKFLWN